MCTRACTCIGMFVCVCVYAHAKNAYTRTSLIHIKTTCKCIHVCNHAYDMCGYICMCACTCMASLQALKNLICNKIDLEIDTCM